MISKEEIKEKYSKLSDEELLKIVNEINSLRKGLIPILQNELKERNLTIGLEKVNNYLLNKVLKKPDDSFDPKAFIEEQLEQGYSLETIKHKLNHMDINMFEVIRNESHSDTFVIEHIKRRRKKGKSVTGIAKELNEKLNIPVEKTKALNEILERDSRRSRYIGIGFIVLSIISVLYTGKISISTVLFFLSGLFSVFRAEKS